jgi:hypothetical protein
MQSAGNERRNTVEIIILHKDEKTCVKSVSIRGKLLYTRTYIFDAEGFVDKMITVFWNGTVDIQ